MLERNNSERRVMLASPARTSVDPLRSVTRSMPRSSRECTHRSAAVEEGLPCGRTRPRRGKIPLPGGERVVASATGRGAVRDTKAAPVLRNRETFTPLSLLRFARFPLPAGERERRFAAPRSTFRNDSRTDLPDAPSSLVRPQFHRRVLRRGQLRMQRVRDESTTNLVRSPGPGQIADHDFAALRI